MLPEFRYDGWFTARRDEKPKQIDKLSGPWASGIDAQQADLHLEGRQMIPTQADYDRADEEYKSAKKKTSGTAAACTKLQPFGIRIAIRASNTAFSA